MIKFRFIHWEKSVAESSLSHLSFHICLFRTIQEKAALSIVALMWWLLLMLKIKIILRFSFCLSFSLPSSLLLLLCKNQHERKAMVDACFAVISVDKKKERGNVKDRQRNQSLEKSKKENDFRLVVVSSQCVCLSMHKIHRCTVVFSIFMHSVLCGCLSYVHDMRWWTCEMEF